MGKEIYAISNRNITEDKAVNDIIAKLIKAKSEQKGYIVALFTIDNGLETISSDIYNIRVTDTDLMQATSKFVIHAEKLIKEARGELPWKG